MNLSPKPGKFILGKKNYPNQTVHIKLGPHISDCVVRKSILFCFSFFQKKQQQQHKNGFILRGLY